MADASPDRQSPAASSIAEITQPAVSGLKAPVTGLARRGLCSTGNASSKMRVASPADATRRRNGKSRLGARRAMKSASLIRQKQFAESPLRACQAFTAMSGPTPPGSPGVITIGLIGIGRIAVLDQQSLAQQLAVLGLDGIVFFVEQGGLHLVSARQFGFGQLGRDFP